MWLYPIILMLFVLGVVGTLLGGGIFTLLLIPIGAVAFAIAMLFYIYGDAPDPPLQDVDTPEKLADARRREQ